MNCGQNIAQIRDAVKVGWDTISFAEDLVNPTKFSGVDEVSPAKETAAG